MPLKSGSDNATVSANIRELSKSKTKGGKRKFSRAQMIAIAMRKAGRSRS